MISNDSTDFYEHPKLKTINLENAKDRRKLLILNIGLVFIIALYSSGVLHA